MIPKWTETDLYKKLYQAKPNYDKVINAHISTVSGLIREFNISSVLDFGCGRHHVLIKQLSKKYPKVKFLGYDPAIEIKTQISTNEFDDSPVDMVVSTDCFEHVPENELNQCFDLISSKNPKVLFFVISTRLASTILPDGSNAHKTVKNGNWWQNKLQSGFLSFEIVQTNSFYEKHSVSEAHFFGVKK